MRHLQVFGGEVPRAGVDVGVDGLNVTRIGLTTGQWWIPSYSTGPSCETRPPQGVSIRRLLRWLLYSSGDRFGAGSILLKGLATGAAARRMLSSSEPAGLLYVRRGTRRTNQDAIGFSASLRQSRVIPPHP